MNNIFRIKKILLFFVLVFSVFFIIGCEDDSVISNMVSGQKEILTINNYSNYFEITEKTLKATGDTEGGYNKIKYSFNISGKSSVVFFNAYVTILVSFEEMHEDLSYHKKSFTIDLALNSVGDVSESGKYTFDSGVIRNVKGLMWTVISVSGEVAKK